MSDGECQEMKNLLPDFSPLINFEISPVTETDVLELIMSIPSHIKLLVMTE